MTDKLIRWGIGAIAVLAMAGLAAIALNPGKARAAEPGKVAWTGCYIGLQAGMGAAKTQLSAEDATLDGLGSQGALGGALAGCDLQLDRLVIGVMADGVLHDNEFKLSIGDEAATARFERQWSVMARGGYLIHPTTLAYLAAGVSRVTMGDLKTPDGDISLPEFSGLSLGGGLETSLGGGLFMGGEYRYTAFDAKTVGDVKIEPDLHVARAHLTYKFGVGN